jgi:hypothetical protein
MSWWQTLLIILGSSLAGILLGALAARLVSLARKRQAVTGLHAAYSTPLQMATGGEHLPKPATPRMRSERPVSKPRPATTKIQSERPAHSSKPVTPKIQPKPPAPSTEPPSDKTKSEKVTPLPRPEAPRVIPPRIVTSPLLAELESNYANATSTWTGQIKTFTSMVWNSRPAELEAMEPSLRNEISEAYVDMHLANRFAWLAEGTGYINIELSKGYLKIREKIAERLKLILADWKKG